MPVRPYNLLLLDGGGRFSQIQAIDPVDEASALQTAEAVLQAYESMSGFELWQGSRRIAARKIDRLRH